MSSTPLEQVPPEVAASQRVFQIATGYIASTALYVAVKLRIADRLADGPKPIAELARESGAHEDALYRVLRLLSSLGIFEETAFRTFVNNPASSTTRSTVQGSAHPMALWLADPFHYRVYADVMHSVTTGRPAAEKTTGANVFAYFERDRELSEVFNNAMTVGEGTKTSDLRNEASKTTKETEKTIRFLNPAVLRFSSISPF